MKVQKIKLPGISGRKIHQDNTSKVQKINWKEFQRGNSCEAMNTEDTVEVENYVADNMMRAQQERYRNIIQELTIMSDIFMRNVLKKAACTELILQVIMGNKDIHILEKVIQMDYKNLQGRSVELDCLARDSEDRRYDIEIENTSKRANPKRARYHSGMIDMNTLEPGQDFEELPETYVIWITEKDILEGNQPIYYISRRIRETEECFPDGEHIVYVNSEIQDDTELGRLMHDFHCKNPDDMYYDVLAERVRELKETPKGVTEMCKELEDLCEELKAEAKSEGREEGRTEERVSSIRNIMETLGVSVEKAMDALKIAADSRETYRKMLEK